MSILYAVAAGVMLSAGVWAVRRQQSGTDARTARGLGVLAALLVVAYGAGVWAIPSIPVLGAAVGDLLTHWYVTAMAGVLSLLAAGMSACAVLAWRQRWWGVLARVHYSAVALTAAALVTAAGARGLLPWF